MRSLYLAVLLVVAIAAPASARPGPQLPRRTALQAASLRPHAERRIARGHQTIARRYQRDRLERVRSQGAIFERIATNHDYSHDYVLERDDYTTAFLDISDPQHPDFDPLAVVHEKVADAIPPSRRVHVLVIPNQPREHITPALGATIGLEDLQATVRVMKTAESLARRLGVRNAKVYMNPESRIGVGYLHVHIVGERGAPYPPALKPPAR